MIELLKTTTALCPKCDKILPAEVINYDGEVILRRTCPTHGAINIKIEKDADFYTECFLDSQPKNPPAKCALVTITHRCNKSCEDCYVPFTGQEDMTLSEYVMLLEEIKNIPTINNINLSGGEPTLHKDFFLFMEEARNRGFTTTVNSNGTLFKDKKFARDYVDAGSVFMVLGMQNFQDSEVLTGIDNLLNLGATICPSLVIRKNTDEHLIKEGLKFCLDRGIKHIRLRSCLSQLEVNGVYVEGTQYFMSELMELTAEACDISKNFFKESLTDLANCPDQKTFLYHVVRTYNFVADLTKGYRIVSPDLFGRKLEISWINWPSKHTLDRDLLYFVPILHLTNDKRLVTFNEALLGEV